jgi:hypothetical protein
MIAIEQEFNTALFGIKGFVDCVVRTKTKEGELKVTALELKNGKHSDTHSA